MYTYDNFFKSGTNEQWIVGKYVDLSGADLSGMDLSDISFNGSYFNGAKTGPLVGTSPSFFSYGYTFVSGTNEQWIIGPDVNLDGADLRGMNLSNINLSGVNLSGAKTWPLNGSAPSSLPDGYDFISGDYQNGIIGPGVDLSDVYLFGADLTEVKSGPLIGDAPTALSTNIICIWNQ